MDQSTIEALEYGSVLKRLAAFSSTTLGEEKAITLAPYREIAEAEKAYKGLKEASLLLFRGERLDFTGITDFRPLIKKAKPAEAFLLPPELLVVGDTLSAIIALKKKAVDSFRKDFPLITGELDELIAPIELAFEIARVIDKSGEVRDDASTELYSIRRSLKSLKETSRRAIESILKDKKLSEYLQDEIITIREDRFVLCVKASFHTQFDGVVHGRSASGSTFFIEPLEIVEANNKLAILKKEEKAEEIRVLKEVTADILAHESDMLNDLSVAGRLDFLQSKALFMEYIGGSIPLLKKSGAISLLKARHPALVFKHKDESSRTPVPIDIMIKQGKMSLVISGANTGGKTVALKTLGLLTLMAESALPVPAEPSSELVFFERVYADIGDRQSISESLSTFSAHLKRLGEIVRKSTKNTLVLIDEIGVGTDPAEGSVLALTILEKLRDMGSHTVVTTHLNLIKAHAQKDETFENASVVFDEKTLVPRYELVYGVPGPSLGLKVAESYGIPKDIIEGARKKLSGDEGRFIESVREAAEERDKFAALNELLRKAEEDKKAALARLRDDRKILLEKAKKKIEAIMVRAEEALAKALSEKKKEIAASAAASAAATVAAVAREEFLEIKEKITGFLAAGEDLYEPKKGDSVTVSGGTVISEILSVDEKKKLVEIKSGNLKVWVEWKKLKRAEKGSKPKAAHFRASAKYVETSTGGETSINIIGLRADEALKMVEAAVDNAHSKGLDTLEIIHGVGTGRLKKAVEEYLKDNKCVKEFYGGDPNKGGAGLTIVKLA